MPCSLKDPLSGLRRPPLIAATTGASEVSSTRAPRVDRTRLRNTGALARPARGRHSGSIDGTIGHDDADLKNCPVAGLITDSSLYTGCSSATRRRAPSQSAASDVRACRRRHGSANASRSRSDLRAARAGGITAPFTPFVYGIGVNIDITPRPITTLKCAVLKVPLSTLGTLNRLRTLEIAKSARPSGSRPGRRNGSRSSSRTKRMAGLPGLATSALGRCSGTIARKFQSDMSPLNPHIVRGGTVGADRRRSDWAASRGDTPPSASERPDRLQDPLAPMAAQRAPDSASPMLDSRSATAIREGTLPEPCSRSSRRRPTFPPKGGAGFSRRRPMVAALRAYSSCCCRSQVLFADRRGPS